jgi:GDSL-like Lipase/Acylhydrolase
MPRILTLVICISLTYLPLNAQLVSTSPLVVGLGDSLGEGVQSLDAAYQTQVHGYLPLVAAQIGVSFPLPLIKTSSSGFVGNVNGRTRLNPSALVADLAVSGANSTSILNTQAGSPIETETDLVLSPRIGSQISVAESLKAPLAICWIGNNDVLGAIVNFDQLNATQITPTNVFSANYDQIASRLGALGGKVVFANIPVVTQVAFLFSPEDLVTFLGSSYGLPEGSYTSLVAMLLIKLGIDDGSILRDPNWVLDAGEIQTVDRAVASFNQIIAAHAALINSPVVDVNALFAGFLKTPPVLDGVTATRRYLGGMFSLDGLHPSDIGYAFIANSFIQTIDSFYGATIPSLSTEQLTAILDADPFVDFNNNLKVKGRFGVGLLETLGPFLGISGDSGDVAPGVSKAMGQKFMQQYLILKGKDPNSKWTERDAIEAFREIFRNSSGG